MNGTRAYIAEIVNAEMATSALLRAGAAGDTTSRAAHNWVVLADKALRTRDPIVRIRWLELADRVHAAIVAGELHVDDNRDWADNIAWPWRHTHNLDALIQHGDGQAAVQAVIDEASARAYAAARRHHDLWDEHGSTVAFTYPNLPLGDLWALLDTDTWTLTTLDQVTAHPRRDELIGCARTWTTYAACDAATLAAPRLADEQYAPWRNLHADAYRYSTHETWEQAVRWAAGGNPDAERVIRELAGDWDASLAALADAARTIAAPARTRQ